MADKVKYCKAKLHINNDGKCIITRQGWHTCFMEKDHTKKHMCICKAKW